METHKALRRRQCPTVAANAGPSSDAARPVPRVRAKAVPKLASTKRTKTSAELQITAATARAWQSQRLKQEQRAIEKRRIQEILVSCGPDPSRRPAKERREAVRQRIALRSRSGPPGEIAPNGPQHADVAERICRD